ncbi:hypothetical protein ACLKA6_012336 [Drosophila palustris]
MDSVHLTLVPDTPNKKGKSSPADLRRNQRSGYKASPKVLKGLEGRSSDTLTAREIKLKNKHEYNVRRFERLANFSSTQVDAPSTSAETAAPGNASKQVASTSRTGSN